MSEDLLSETQAAAYLGVHRHTLRKWRKDGKLSPDFIAPRHTFYSRAYLDKVAPALPRREWQIKKAEK